MGDIVLFDRGTVEYGYSYDDELVSQINGRGDGITYEYDDNGDVTKEVADGVETAFTYDVVGNQLTSGNITREYDLLGRVVSKTVGNDTIGYEYDKRGHMVKMTYPNGDAVSYQYDVMGNLLSVKDWNDKVTSYEYDANNRLILTKNWNGTSEERGYDKAGQLVSIERSDGTSESFEYDLNGNIVKENDSVYQYDVLNRLIVADDHSYDYDDYGSITEVAHSKYDLVMQYGDDNELTRVNGKYTDIDSDGNLLSYTGADDKKHTAVYDAKNRMTSYDGVEYGYDSENNRVSIGDTNLVVDNDGDRLSRVLVERTGDDEVRYVYGNGLIGSYSDDDFTTHHYDLRGSTVSVSNDSGDVLGHVEYDEYGVVMSKDDVVNTRFLYNGQFGVQTDDNGLYHMRARYYNPEIKRFMNRDVVAGSIAEPQTLNRYAYVNGDPVSYHDPFGLAREMLFSDSTLDMLQTGLDFVGFAPVVGNIADALNATVSLSRGNYKDAFWDTVAILPFGNIAKTGVKSVDRVADYGKIRSSGDLDLLPDEGNVGTYRDLVKKGFPYDNITPHHMPSAAKMNQAGVHKNKGVAMNMEQPNIGGGGRHRSTYTYGLNGEKLNDYLELSYRDALALDINDAAKIYKDQNLYTADIRKGLLRTISKNKELFPELFKK